nr:glycosyltransferase [uncultured Deefgea sp.]
MPLKVILRISVLGFGGAERVFLSIAEYLYRKQGCEVIFVVDRLAGENDINAQALGIQVISLDVKRTIQSILPFKKVLEKIKPDIVLSAYPDTNGAALLSQLWSKHKCPVLVSEHSSIKNHFKNSGFKRRKQVDFIVSYIYRLADHIICVSNGLRDELSVLCSKNENISTIYNPIRFATNVDEVVKNRSFRNILAVGRITLQKDFLTLLRSFSMIQHQNTTLTILGGVSDEILFQQLQDYINLNNLSERVQFSGYTNTPEVFYRNADLFVLSSAWEGFGNVIVEAMSFGLPVVSTNCDSGPAEILKNGQFGRLVPVGDAMAMAAAIDDVLQTNPFNPMLQRKRAEDFSVEKIGFEYFTLFNSLILSRHELRN